MENKLQLLKPRFFSDLLTDTFSFVKLNFKPMLQVVLFLVLPILVFGCYFFSNYFKAIFSVMGQTDPTEVTRAIMGTIGSIALGYFGIIIGILCLYLTVIQTFLKYEASETGVIEASDIFTGIKESILPFLGFNFVFGLLFAVALGLVIGIIAGIAVAGGTAIAVLLGFAAFGLFFYAILAVSFSPVIYLRERNGIFNAISRSFYLIRGHWWQTFGTIFVMQIVVQVVSMIFIIPFYAMFFISVLHGVKNGGAPSFEMSNWAMVAFGFMMCGITIMSSIIHMAVVMQYYSLVERKEGINVMQQIENIGATENPVG